MTLKGYFMVCRPPLTFLGALASVALLKWSGQLWTWKGLLIVLCIFFGNLGMNILNEVHDEPVDRVNKPRKPCPSGQVNMDTCWKLGMMFVFISGSLVLFLIDTFGYIYFIAFLGLFASGFYNFFRRDLLGNLAMSTAYAVAAFMSLYPKHLLFCVSWFMLVTAFNLLTQFQDRLAERTKGVITAPMQLGDRGTGYVVALLSLAGIGVQKTLTSPPMFVFFVIFYVLLGVGFIVAQKVNEGFKSKIIENLVRRLGRLLLIVGFGLMLLW